MVDSPSKKQTGPWDLLYSHADWFILSLLFYEQNESVQLGQQSYYPKMLKFKSAYSVGTQLPDQVNPSEEASMSGQNSDGAVYMAVP